MKGPSPYKSIISERKTFPSRTKTVLYSLFRFILRILDNFFHDSCFIRASGLAFNTLLALVPLSAVIFAFGGLSDVSGELQDFLMEVLLPSSLNQILDAISVFTANSTKLGTWGIIFFLITILFLMNNIENNLNAIWHCRRRRTFFQRFTIYTTVIVFASLLIGGNFSLSGQILAIFPEYSKALKEPFFLTTLFRFSSILFITLIFLLLNLLIPSTKVSLRSAFTGALTGAVIWELAKWGFKTWASTSVRNSVIYGSLFLIPLLLIWLYVAWLIIMISMETAYVHQHRDEKHRRYVTEKRSADTFESSLEIYLLVARFFTNGTKLGTVENLAREASLGEEEVNMILTLLLREGLISRSEEGWYFPSAPPESMPLFKLYSRLGGLDGSKDQEVMRFRTGGEHELDGKTVSDLIGKADD